MSFKWISDVFLFNEHATDGGKIDRRKHNGNRGQRVYLKKEKQNKKSKWKLNRERKRYGK